MQKVKLTQDPITWMLLATLLSWPLAYMCMVSKHPAIEYVLNSPSQRKSQSYKEHITPPQALTNLTKELIVLIH